MGCGTSSEVLKFNKREEDPNNQSQIKKFEYGKYIWNLKNDKMDRKGAMYFDNGDRYEGLFKDDKRNGFGTYYYKNGNRYEGDFKNGQFEGNGRYFFGIIGIILKGNIKKVK